MRSIKFIKKSSNPEKNVKWGGENDVKFTQWSLTADSKFLLYSAICCVVSEYFRVVEVGVSEPRRIAWIPALKFWAE